MALEHGLFNKYVKVKVSLYFKKVCFNLTRMLSKINQNSIFVVFQWNFICSIDNCCYCLLMFVSGLLLVLEIDENAI